MILIQFLQDFGKFKKGQIVIAKKINKTTYQCEEWYISARLVREVKIA